MGWKMLLLVLALGTVATLFFGANDYVPSQQRTDERAIEWCWKEQARKSLTPAAARLAAGACERMEEKYAETYGRRP